MSHEQGRGWGLGRREEARAWSAANVSALVAQDAPRAWSQEGTPSPGPLPEGRRVVGGGGGGVAAPASGMEEHGLLRTSRERRALLGR